MYITSKPPEIQFSKKLKTSKAWEWIGLSDKNIVRHYFEDTSFNGCSYIGQQGRHICERIFWVVSFLSSATAAGFLIYNLWQGYLLMPVITVVSSNRRHIDEIPFPSVTICTNNYAKRSLVEEYIEQALNTSEVEDDNTVLEAYAALADIQGECTRKPTLLESISLEKGGKRFFKIPEHIQVEMNKRRKDYMKFSNPVKYAAEMAHTCDEILLHCAWLGKPWDCGDLFKTVWTHVGVCCTFNLIPYLLVVKFKYQSAPTFTGYWEEWKEVNSENLLFTTETKNRNVPFRQKNVGKAAGLSVVLNPHLQEYTCTDTDSYGFMVTLNQAIDVPSVHNQIPIAVPINSEVVIGIRPKVILSDPSIERFEPNVRQCYLGEEFQMAYFNKYTLQNCHWDCLYNITANDCGCRVIDADVSANLPLCGTLEFPCIRATNQKLINKGYGEACPKCLPTCTEIHYYTETSISSLRKENVAMLTTGGPNFNATQSLSILHLFFGTNSVFPMVRKEMHARIDLVSAAGGILGLCMGCSVLSLLEIVYYFTIRVCCVHCNMKRTRKVTTTTMVFVASRQNP